jgi:hypothetical protein
MGNITKQLRGKCKHFTGTVEKQCKAGMVYDEVIKRKELGDIGCMLRLPCTGKAVGSITRDNAVLPCDKYCAFTEAEIEQEQKDWDRTLELLIKGLSPCCGAEIDTSHVITEGKHKGHGQRFCSKCHKVVFIV